MNVVPSVLGKCRLAMPHAVDVNSKLSPLYEEIFSIDGFLSIENMASPSEVAEIREVASRLIRERVGLKEGALFDTLASSDAASLEGSIELSNPSSYSPALLKTSYVLRAAQVAKQILSGKCVLLADLVFLKQAGCGRGTPWHQDEAYRDPSFAHRELTFWMPLQDVSIEDGCMVFVPGSHKAEVFEHRSPNNDSRVHAFECSKPLSEDSPIVACPLPAGGCTLHGSRTLHCTHNNTSSVDRYAYVLIFGIPPQGSSERRSFPWRDSRRNSTQELKRAWLMRGGFLKAIIRRWKSGNLKSPQMLRYTFRRGSKLLFRKWNSL